MKYIDLFGGIGGFRYGIEQSNKNWECIWYCDNNKYAVGVYDYQFEENYSPTDIRGVDVQSIPDFDLLCAGFPCQSFSLAGKRRGFEDMRGTLFFEIARIAKAKRPKYMLLENVKGILSNQKGETFRIILQTLDELGYDVQWMVLNSKFFGVPQHRERVFFIANLRDESAPEILPFRKDTQVLTEDDKTRKIKLQTQVCGAIAGGELREYNTFVIPLVTNTVTEAVGTRQGSSKEFLRSVEKIMQSTGQIRRLTPKECERLQGFPDDWTKYGLIDGRTKELSDTQRYRLLGNAVTTTVVEAIANKWCGE